LATKQTLKKSIQINLAYKITRGRLSAILQSMDECSAKGPLIRVAYAKYASKLFKGSIRVYFISTI